MNTTNRRIKILQIPIGSTIPDRIWEKIKDIEFPAEIHFEGYLVRISDILSKCPDQEVVTFLREKFIKPDETIKIRSSLCQEISE